ncbi:MAG: TetR-like C-terminal domain-containing protein, partial [Geobacteraceae bacterium]|nr:TetR-like C-terminal domain-containing protein [Geobacteraceae bacterium]
ERQLSVIQKAGRDKPSPVPRLRAELRAYIDFGLSEPGRYQIVYMADLSQYVSMASILEEGSPAFRLRELIRREIDDVLGNTGGDLDTETISQAVWAHCHGIVSLLIGRPDFPWVDRERLIETGLDILLSGLNRRMVR